MTGYTNPIEQSELDPSNLRDIAEAMAWRDQFESERQQRFFVEVTGEPIPEHSEEYNSLVHSIRTSLSFSRISSPDMALSRDEVRTSLVHEMTMSEGLFDEETKEADIKAAMFIVDTLLDAVIPDDEAKREETNRKFASFYETVQAVAARNNVPVQTVYRDESLYGEVIREQNTPESYATAIIDAATVLRTETMNTVLSNVIANEELETTNPEQVRAELEADEEFQQIVDATVANLKTLVYAYGRHELERIWGVSTVTAALSEETKSVLGMTDETTPRTQRMASISVGNAVLFVPEDASDDILRRQAFVDQYFAARGWDVTKPTIEQTLEVRARPEWQ